MIKILLLNPIYVTIFWAIVLNLYKREAHQPKVFLGWYMFVASWVYISHYFYFTQQFGVYYYLDSIYTLAYLLVYPMYHVYVRLLTVDSHFSFKKHLRFLVAPLAIFLLTAMGYIVMDKDEGVQFISDILVHGKPPASTMQEVMYIVFVIGRLTFLFQTIFYLVISFRLIRSNNLRIQDYYSNMEERKLNWLQFFNICFAITSTSSAALAVLGRNTFLENPYLLVFPSVVFTLMLFFIGLLGNNQRAIFTEIDNTPDFMPEGKPPQRIKLKIDKLFEEEMIYKDPDLKIWDVSSMVGTNRTYVSNVINNAYGRNFCTHVNVYRIEHAKSLIQSNPNLTNQQIAELAGFGSVNSLYRTFQTSEGVSLGQFRKQVNNS
jgi:AraC-like DNA-binding protein